MSILVILKNLLSIFMSRNHFLFNLGLSLIVGAIIVGLIPLIKRISTIKKVRFLAFVIGIGFVILSFFTRTGSGFGANGDSGVGLLDNPETSHESSPAPSIQPDTKPDQAGDQITIEIKMTHVFVNGIECSDPKELEEMIEASLTDDSRILLVNNYADNSSYLWVTNKLEEMHVKYDEEQYTE